MEIHPSQKVGFTRQSKRQFKIWDARKVDKEIACQDIDQAAGGSFFLFFFS